MNLYWDHTVQYTNNLDAAVETFKEKGLHAFRGGSHQEWGTYNALSYFGLDYVEFLAIENEELIKRNRHLNAVVFDAARLLPEKEVLARIALRTHDMNGVYNHLSEKGVATSQIVPGSRMTKEGKLIKWKMLMIHGDFHGVVYPFIIEWNETDEERLASLKHLGALQSTNTQLQSATIYSPYPEKLAQHWSELFGFTILSQTNVVIQDHRFTFEKGDPNQSLKLEFSTDLESLKGTTLTIGEGQYVFK